MKVVATVAEKVVVRREVKVTRSAGGLHLPDAAQEKNCWAEVVALPRVYDGPLKVGDRVLLEWFAGTELEPNSRLYTCRAEDVLAVEQK